MPQGFGKKGTPAPNHPRTIGPADPRWMNLLDERGLDESTSYQQIIRLYTSKCVPTVTVTKKDDGHGYAESMQGVQ